MSRLSDMQLARVQADPSVIEDHAVYFNGVVALEVLALNEGEVYVVNHYVLHPDVAYGDEYSLKDCSCMYQCGFDSHYDMRMYVRDWIEANLYEQYR